MSVLPAPRQAVELVSPAPGAAYYLRLAVGATMFGRKLSFRTQVADADPMHLKVALLSCQRNVSTANLTQPT